ncbi:MAG: hypothetical protein SOY97_04710 [Candidatus Metalachnospira sp.]|nr:hypothetical protein [Candidatus Metalachnospira sp.]
MAGIREVFTLVDQFSSTFSKYISMAEKSAGATTSAQQATEGLEQSQREFADGINISERALNEYASMINSLEREITKLSAIQEAQGAIAEKMEGTDDWAEMETAVQKTADKLAKVTAEYEALVNVIGKAGVGTEVFTLAQEKATKAAGGTTEEMSRLQKTIESAKNSKVGDALSRQFRRFGLALFTTRRILAFLRNSLDSLPKSITSGWTNATKAAKNFLIGGIGAFLQGLQPALDRFNAAMNSNAGQKFARGFETAMRGIGNIVGFVVDKISMLIEFIGNNFQTIMTVAAIAAGFFAAKMLLSAAATVAANLPLILMVAALGAIVVGLMSAGITSQQIFGAIGAGAGWLYSLIYNIVADLYNVFASFAEFFANFMDDPINAVLNLFIDLADGVLGILENIASAIDAIFGSNLASAVTSWRQGIEKWANENLSAGNVKFDRMEHIDYKVTMDNWSSKASDFADKLSDFSLENSVAVPLSNIESDTKSIKKAVNMADEDIKSLVDLATRQYVNKINLTSQTPIINITGQNTGNTIADKKALADSLRDVILEQAAAMSSRSTARVMG